MAISRMELKVKVIGQANAVVPTSVEGRFFSSLNCFSTDLTNSQCHVIRYLGLSAAEICRGKERVRTSSAV